MLTAAITRPLFTYTKFFFFLCNLIPEKLCYLLFHVESGKFFLGFEFLAFYYYKC
jgi:hypothetical protein